MSNFYLISDQSLKNIDPSKRKWSSGSAVYVNKK